MRYQLVRALLFVAVLACCVVARGQQTFTSESKSWSFTMPAEWQPVSANQLATIKAEYQKRDPGHPGRVVAAFWKGSGLFPYPQVVLQVADVDTSRLSWEALSRMLRNGEDDSPGASAAKVVADLVETSQPTDWQLKTESNEVRAKGELTVVGPGPLETASRAFLFGGGVVQLTGFGMKSSVGSAQQSVDLFGNTFHFDQSRVFQPAVDVQRQRVSNSRSSGSGYGYYGGGGGVVLVIGIIVRIALRMWIRRD